MPNLNFSVADALNRTSSMTANFLSSLNAAFGGVPGAGVFDSLLSQTNTSVPPPQPVTNFVNPVTTPAANNVVNNPVPPPSASLQDVLSVWRSFIEKWQSHKNGNSGSGQSGDQKPAVTDNKSGSDAGTAAGGANANNGTTTQTSNTAPPSDPSQPAVTVPVASSTGSGNSPADPVPAAASSQNPDPNTQNPPTLADLIAELQAILQMIQRQIQNTQTTVPASGATAQNTATIIGPPPDLGSTPNSGGTPATANTSNVGNPSDSSAVSTPSAGSSTDNPKDITLLAAADMMLELLLLSRFVEKKLAPDPASDPQTAAGAPAAQSVPASDLASLDAQLKANLKTVLDALQTSVAANGNINTAAPAPDATNASATVSTGLALSTLPTATTPPPANPLSPPDIVKSGLVVATDFLQQLNTLFAAPPPVSANAALVAATATTVDAGGNGASLDSDTTDNNSAPAKGMSGNAGDTPPLAVADGAKSANPYNFASQLSALRASNGGAMGLPSAVEQVMLQLSRNVKSGNDQMTLQLQPADLGRIDIKLNFSADGKVQGTVVATNPVTLDLLLKDVRGLERALQEAGLSADPGSLQFSLGGQSGNASDQTAGNSSSGTSSGGDNAALTDISVAADADFVPTETWYITPGGVNIQV